MSEVPVLRVNQMNAIYFDNEIYKLFLEHMQACWKHLQVGAAIRTSLQFIILVL